ncbi:2-oxo acid dehydrogenase subunit E2 [Kutzneria sp. NPDC052558]|uniref:2-oxo acid dehydrogenase subunit E2 n=1 Tax=Kutzneria sp. NPDC052558 TaxID=3364121 RepID=UPI0037C818A3
MISEIRLEQEGVNDACATVTAWFVVDGQRVTEGDALLEIETSKVTVEITAPGDGYVVPAVPVRHEAQVGDVVAFVCANDDDLDEARTRRVRPAAAEPSDAGAQRFSPAALDYVQEHSIPLDAFDGTSVVTLRDAEAAAKALTSAAAEPLGRAKALEVERLTKANVLNASITVQFDGAAVRKRAAGAPVPSMRLLAIVVHAIASALREFPALNAWFDDGVRAHSTIEVGIAIDLDDGLKVGVVHNADKLDLAATEARVGELISRYLNGALTVSDVTGGGVTVSDLSMEDVLFFQPLLNDGQALAIGLGGDRVLPGEPITITATFDHRVTTGREVSQFLNRCRHTMTDHEEIP